MLLARLAEAHWRLRERARAIETWFALCRLAPEVFEEMIESSDFPDWSLQHAWRVAQEQALEHEVTPAWFPAWMLLEEPGLADVFAPRHADDEPSRAFDLVIALLSHPDVDERGIELRRSLQDIHPGLLERYLAKRTRATTARPFSGYPATCPSYRTVRADLPPRLLCGIGVREHQLVPHRSSFALLRLVVYACSAPIQCQNSRGDSSAIGATHSWFNRRAYDSSLSSRSRHDPIKSRSLRTSRIPQGPRRFGRG